MNPLIEFHNFQFKDLNGNIIREFEGCSHAILYDSETNSLYFWSNWRIMKTDLNSGITKSIPGKGIYGTFIEGNSSESQIGNVSGMTLKNKVLYFTDGTNDCIGMIEDEILTQFLTREFEWKSPEGIVYNAMKNNFLICNQGNYEIIEVEWNNK